MAAKKTQYVLLPAMGTMVSQTNQHQLQFFRALHNSVSGKGNAHTLPTPERNVPIKVIDSIGENKAKLVEMTPDDLPAFRGVHPSVRVVPVVYYRPAVFRYEVMSPPEVGAARAAGRRASAAKTKKAAKATAGGITVAVVSSKDGKPVRGATVVAFIDFRSRAGAQGTTNAKGLVNLNLGAATKKVERVYVYPESGYWPGLTGNVTLSAGSKITVLPIDNGYADCVRHFYGNSELNTGEGVTVGVIDSGVATNHPDLKVQGGQNTVTGENKNEYGDNGGEGHGTHVSGIIAARGTAPKGVRGVAPGVTLRSYRVFGKGSDNASNFAIAKAIDAGVADKCDLLNMSLGGGPADQVTAEAIAAAYQAGIVIFAANGNDDRQSVSFPAASPMCQAVSAMGRKGTIPPNTEPMGSIAAPYGTDKKNFVASFSNIGPDTDLTGPGVGVISTVPTGYGVMSGTSMATPAETGAAARLLAGKTAILKMPRDQHRSAAMVTAITNACKLLGFGSNFEGKGMISF